MSCIELMKHRILLRVLIGFCALGCAVGAYAMEFVFRRPSYESNLTVTAFLASRERLIALLAEKPDTKLHRETYAELEMVTRRYLVVQIINTGDQGAWGSVTCSFDGRKIVINVPFLPALMDSPNIYVSEISSFALPDSNRVPSVSVSWRRLYAK